MLFNLFWTKPLKKTQPKNNTHIFCFSPFPPNPGCLTPPHPGGPPAQGPCPLSAEAPIPGPLLRAPVSCMERACCLWSRLFVIWGGGRGGKRPPAQGQGRGQLAGRAWSTVVGDCGLCSVHFSLAFFVPFLKGMRAPPRGWGGSHPLRPQPRLRPGLLCRPFADAPLLFSRCLSLYLALLPPSPLCLPVCHLVSLPLLLWPLSPHPPAFLLTGCLSISFLTSFGFLYHLPHPSHLLSSTLAPCRMAGGPDGSVWTEAFLMTCLPQRPRLPLTPGPVTCIRCRLPPSLTCVSFLHRSGDTEEGAPHPSPHGWPRPSLHIRPGPCLGSGANAASWPWGHRTPAHSHHPASPKGPFPARCPFGLL